MASKAHFRHDWGEAFATFATWAPHERTYQRLADHLGTSKRTVERAAQRERWTARLDELDAEVQRKAEARVIRARADRTADTLRVIDAARTRFAGQVARSDFRLTGSDFVGLVKLEQLLEGEATDRVSLTEAQSLLQLVFAAAMEWAAKDVPPAERRAGLKGAIDEIVSGLATGGEMT